ncbi:hypothetical protein BDD12DRAFT_902814 [Trichophaea hybrida]|nr:hypothetical protein BDD12DRAFT_902814 [Trichophaea hybrida]
MDNSEFNMIFVKTTINCNLQETPFTIKPDPNADFDCALQLIIPIEHKVINHNNDAQNEKPIREAVPVDDDKLELFPMTNIAISSTADILPIQLIDCDFKMEVIENMIHSNADFNNMVVIAYEEGTGNNIESQTLNN